MGNNSKIIKYQTNDIMGIMRVLKDISSFSDTRYFYDFAKNYGTKKMSNILNSRGVDFCNISKDGKFDVVDKVSKHIFNNISNKKYVNAVLGSPYYYTKYVHNPATNQMVEQKVLFKYNALVNNKKVDVKSNFKVYELKKLADSKDLILLGIKEQPLSNELAYFDNLCPVEKEFFNTVGDGLVQKPVFPSIKYAGNESILKNLDNFEKEYPNLKTEMAKANKKMAQKFLAFEVENQQIVLKSALEKGQVQFKNLVEEYQSKAVKIQNLINLNEKLLSVLGETSESTDFELGKELWKKSCKTQGFFVRVCHLNIFFKNITCLQSFSFVNKNYLW